MIIANGTIKKLRFSVMKDKSENEQYEAFAYVIAPGNALNIPEDEGLVISEEKEV